MDLLAQGLTGEQVAERLFLSPETIKTHIRNAMNKLEAHTRVHAIAIALRKGFISPPTGRRALVSDDDLVLDGEARRRLRHDLRTPLTIVAGFAEVLAADRADLRRRPARVRHPHPGRGGRDPPAHRPGAGVAAAPVARPPSTVTASAHRHSSASVSGSPIVSAERADQRRADDEARVADGEHGGQRRARRARGGRRR